MNYSPRLFKIASAAVFLTGGAALANQDYCPATGQWIDPGTPCVAVPPPDVDTPDEYTTWHNNLTQTINHNLASVGVGVGTGGNATGGAGGNSSATGGSSNQTQSQSSHNSNSNASASSANNGGQSVAVDNRTSIRNPASTAATVIPGGYGPANCFGDTNPSGHFGASMQGFLWGVTASSQKASNVCAIAALAGPAAAIGYLQRMDPNIPRGIVVNHPTGRLTCPASHPIYVESRGCRKSR